VSRHSQIISVLFISTVFSCMGCISSEETGAGDRAKSPLQISGPLDTAQRAGRHEIQHDSLLQSTNKPFSASEKSSRIAPKFKSKQDTVRASMIKKTKSSDHPRIKIERPEHPVYTVQIGAFGEASNALRTQKKAKGRFTNQPVFNKYIKSAKLYRVSIGRYKNRDDAFALADTMKQQYSKEYSQCWINFIP
jgi:cell division septation protein DedD